MQLISVNRKCISGDTIAYNIHKQCTIYVALNNVL